MRFKKPEDYKKFLRAAKEDPFIWDDLTDEEYNKISRYLEDLEGERDEYENTKHDIQVLKDAFLY